MAVAGRKTTSRGGRPSLERAGQIKEDIVAIASDRFLRDGYGAVSIESVAKAAGISKRTFYHRFRDKAELFAAVIHQLTQAIRPAAADQRQLFEGANLRVILQKIALAILQAGLSPTALAIHRLLLSEAGRFPELSGVMAKSTARQEAVDLIAQLLDRAVRAGEISLPNAYFAAEQFLHMVMGSPQRRALGLGDPLPVSDYKAWASDCVDLFLNGCRYGS